MAVIQQDFEKYYAEIFGARWLNLKNALLQKEKQVRRYNHFSHLEKVPSHIDWIPESDWHQEGGELTRGVDDLLSYYVLDPASVLVAENLKVVPGEKVLDLCAAPGGKSLVMAQALFRRPQPSSELVLNELSSDRRERLKKVIQQYIPRDVRNQVWVKGKDGTRFGLSIQNYFDAILLDAPCSGERHLLANPKVLSEWSLQRTKRLAQRQYALLCSAWMALKAGGRIMYSTCALSPLENDAVIERFLEKKEDAQKGEIVLRGPGAEQTSCGIIYLPDECGFGPMYSALLVKSSGS